MGRGTFQLPWEEARSIGTGRADLDPGHPAKNESRVSLRALTVGWCRPARQTGKAACGRRADRFGPVRRPSRDRLPEAAWPHQDGSVKGHEHGCPCPRPSPHPT